MQKGTKIIILISIVSVLIIGCISVFAYKSNNSANIPEDYIALFHGNESSEYELQTYIYKIDNGQANMGFKYINVTASTKSWGSSEWIYKINKKGTFDWTDGAFMVAKEHGAYSYVTLPNDNKTYTIEEFQSMFIMN